MIVAPTPWSEIVRRTAWTFVIPLAWIAGSLSLLPVRRFAEPSIAVILDLLLSRRRYGIDHYDYASGHYVWFVAVLVAIGVGCLAITISSAAGAPALERRLNRRLQQRVDEVELRNTRTLDDFYGR